MSRFLLLIGLLFLPLQSFASTLYTVNIAVYKNKYTLQKRINKLPPKLRKTIQVAKKKNLYRASTLPTANKAVLKKLLPRYKKEFSDAHIAKVQKSASRQHKER